MQTAERVSFRDPSDNVIFQRHLVAYNQAKKHVSGKVLEIGCGEGYGIEMLAPLSEEFTAIDKYETDLSFIKNQKNVHFQKMNIPPITFPDNTFDSAVSFQVIEHIENDDSFVKEIARVLKPNAKLVLTTPNRIMSLTRNPWHVREYLHKELESLLKKYFSKVEMTGVVGNNKVMEYYSENKASVQKITRWDILNLQYRLPRQFLQVPYDILNRLNRKKLLSNNDTLVNKIKVEDYALSDNTQRAFDFFCVATK